MQSKHFSVTSVLTRRHERAWLMGLLITALLLRLAFALTRPTDEVWLAGLPDQGEYLQLGRNLLENSTLAFFDPVFADTLYAYRMPGYPVFVALAGGEVWGVRLLQCVIDSSLVAAVYLLGRRLAISGLASGVAMAFVAFNPLLIYFCALVLSETLFTAMLVWGMVLILNWRRWVFGAGLLMLVGSIYVRPSAIGLPVLLAVLTPLLRPTTGRRSFWRVPAGALAVGLTVVALFPWAARNKAVVDAWVWTTTNSGVTAFDGFNEHADGSSNQAFFRSWPELKPMSEVQRSRYLAGLARGYIAGHPGESVRLAGLKIARTWSPIPLSQEYGRNWLYVLVGAVYAVPLFAAVVAGIGLARVDRAAKLFLLLPAIYFTAVHAMSVGSLRYRVPADVPMAVIAGAGVAAYWQRRREGPGQAATELPTDDRSVTNGHPDRVAL